MRVERIQRKHRNISVRCHNGCKANSDGRMTEMGYRVATHRLWLIGYPTPVCDVCAKEWAHIYNENLGSVKQALAA